MKAKTFDEDSWQIKLTDWFIRKKLETMDGKFSSIIQDVDRQACARELDKLYRIDKKGINYIKTVLTFAIENDFWARNLICLTAIRKRSRHNDLRKFSTIELSMPLAKKQMNSIYNRLNVLEKLDANVIRSQYQRGLLSQNEIDHFKQKGIL